MRVWRHPAALRPPPTDPPLQIAADCALEWDSSTNNRNPNKAETDFTKNGKLAEGRSKQPSYKMLIQKLAELNTLGESGGDLRKIYRSTPEAEQVWKKNTMNQQLEPTAASTGSVQTSGPQRDVHYHSALPPRASALNNARWPGIEGCRGEGEPIDPFHCRPVPVRREDQRFFLPLWILKPTNNKPNLLPGGQCSARRSCMDLGQEPSEAEEMSSGHKMEQEGSAYPYPDFLPPPFNRVDFSELSLLEEHQWKEALPARPNSPLGQLIGRIVQLEKIQLMTIQKEKGRQPETAPGASPKAASTRKKAKRGRKCRRGDVVCLQQPHSEVCLKKANPARMAHHKHLYRVSSGQSCSDPHDLHSSSEDLKHRRHCRANWSSYQPYKRSVPDQVILSSNNSAFVTNQPFSAVEAGQTLAVHKPANIIHYKHKKKQM